MYYFYYLDCKFDICPIFMFANSIKKNGYGIISTTQYILILFKYYVDLILNFRCCPVVIHCSISSKHKMHRNVDLPYLQDRIDYKVFEIK